MELSSYISFTGQAREAMEFYQSVFGGELLMNTFAEFGMEGEIADQIMHASLGMPSGQTLMGSDTPPGMEYTEGKRVRMIVQATTRPSCASTGTASWSVAAWRRRWRSRCGATSTVPAPTSSASTG